MSDPNAEAIEAWNTVLFDKFIHFRETWTRGASVHGDAVMERHAPREGARVLDVGCGCGDTTLALAKRVGPKGEAVGIDAAPRFIDLAQREARELGVANARFVVADPQKDDLGGPYDLVYSRFGTMFFASPVAALRSMRRALVSGGKLAMVVWRRKDENAVYFDVEQRVLAIVPHAEKREDQVTCGPGPFSMASPDVVSAQLKAAGFGRIAFERFDTEMLTGRSVDEAIEFALAIGPAGEVMRLGGEEAVRRRPAVVASLRELFESWSHDGAVRGACSSWIVSAVAV